MGRRNVKTYELPKKLGLSAKLGSPLHQYVSPLLTSSLWT